MTTPGRQGRFDGYDVLAVASHWDQVTTDVVVRRLAPAGPLQFFSDEQAGSARALVDCLLDQDAAREPYVDVLADVDARLAADVTDGWHHLDMPPDPDAWRITVQHLDADCQERFGSALSTAKRPHQLAVVQAVQDQLGGCWHDLPTDHVWSLWTRYACAAFYAHPWAWNEIGFGGPAYPRGYKNIGLDRREPWERPEHDAHDPVGWAVRTERARQAHLDSLGHSR